MSTDHRDPTYRKCTLCNAPALKKAEPDGVLRCFGHSQDPVNVAKREANAARGAKVAAQVAGVPVDERGKVLAGVVSIDQARAAAIASKAKQAKAEAKNEEVEPVALDSRDKILGALGDAMGRLRKGVLDAQEANAAASLCRAALAVLGAELPDDGDDEEEPRAFSYRTPTGRVVNVRGRD